MVKVTQQRKVLILGLCEFFLLYHTISLDSNNWVTQQSVTKAAKGRVRAGDVWNVWLCVQAGLAPVARGPVVAPAVRIL